MKIFNDSYLRDFDKLKPNTPGNKTNTNNKDYLRKYATLSQVSKRIYTKFILPSILIGSATFCLYLYNKHIESTWLE
jgi:hypothetical protein